MKLDDSSVAAGEIPASAATPGVSAILTQTNAPAAASLPASDTSSLENGVVAPATLPLSASAPLPSGSAEPKGGQAKIVGLPGGPPVAPEDSTKADAPAQDDGDSKIADAPAVKTDFAALTASQSLPANLAPASKLDASPVQNYHLVQVAVTPGQPLADQVSLKIKVAAAGGIDKIRLQLHPEDLGTVDVSISVIKGEAAQVHVTADKQETLNLLAKDSSSLNRALNDAGIKTDANSLQFDLRQSGQQHPQSANSGASTSGNGDEGGGNASRHPGDPRAFGDEKDDFAASNELSDQGMYRLMGTNGINIRV